jgi:hypothetical protein
MGALELDQQRPGGCNYIVSFESVKLVLVLRPVLLGERGKLSYRRRNRTFVKRVLWHRVQLYSEDYIVPS